MILVLLKIKKSLIFLVFYLVQKLFGLTKIQIQYVYAIKLTILSKKF